MQYGVQINVRVSPAAFPFISSLCACSALSLNHQIRKGSQHEDSPQDLESHPLHKPANEQTPLRPFFPPILVRKPSRLLGSHPPLKEESSNTFASRHLTVRALKFISKNCLQCDDGTGLDSRLMREAFEKISRHYDGRAEGFVHSLAVPDS